MLNNDNSNDVVGDDDDDISDIITGDEDPNSLLPVEKIATSITFTQEVSEVLVNANIHVDGHLSGMVNVEGVTIEVEIICPDDFADSPIQGRSVVADANGEFGLDYVPSMIGTFMIEATFAGNDAYKECSAYIVFEAYEEEIPMRVPSFLNLTSGSSEVQLGETVEIAGLLTSDMTSGSIAIAGASLRLAITDPSDDVTPLSIVTDENGVASHVFTANEAGTYVIRAYFDGNSGYYPCSNNVSVTVPETPEKMVKIEWVSDGCPNPAYSNLGNTYTAEISISDDEGVTWRHTSHTQLFFTFISMNGGSTYRVDGWTPQYPATLTGRCSVNFTPIDADIGDYIVTVYYQKVEGYQAASVSTIISVEKGYVPIVKTSTAISLTPASTSVNTGSIMHVDGLLTNVSGVRGATVLLEVVLPDGSVVNPSNGASTVTGANGEFSIDYVPTVLGTHTFRAAYEGDTYNDGSSKNVAFSATAPAVPVTTSYYYTVSSTGVVKNSDGTTVYTGTPRNAIVWAQANCPSGKSIGLLAGTFNIDSYIYVYRSLYGQGVEKTILKAADGLSVSPSMIYIRSSSGYGVTGITIKDIQFNGNTAKNSAKTYGCIEPMGASYCNLVNLYIHDFPKGFGIETRGCHHMKIENCEIGRIGSTLSGMWANGICVGGDIMTIGSTTYSSSYNIIRNCTVYDCSMVGFNCEPGDHNLFQNCTYTESSGFAPYWMSGSTKIYNRAVTVFTWGDSTRNGGHPSDYNVFRDCYFAKPGILVANYGDHTELDNCTLVMTALSGEGYAPAYAGVGTLNYGTQGSDYAYIHDCTVYFKATSSGGRGIHLNLSDHCTLTNNKIINTGVLGKGYGIENDGSYNTISGTSCTGTATCVGV